MSSTEPCDQCAASCNLLKEIIEHSHNEIAGVRTAYKFAVTIVGFIVAIGLFFSYSSIREFKTDLIKEASRVQDQLKEDTELLSRNLQKEISNEIVNVQQKISKRIDTEFETEQIKTLVSDVASERLRAMADDLIRLEVEKKIVPLSKELKLLIDKEAKNFELNISKFNDNFGKINETEAKLEENLGKSIKALEYLILQTEFLSTSINAQSGNRKSFNQVREWAFDNKYAFRKEAFQMWTYINDMYGSRLGKFRSKMTFTPDDGKSKATIKEVLEMWDKISASGIGSYDASLVDYVWNNPDFDIEVKLDFLYKILREDKGSLEAAQRAAIHLSQYANIPYDRPLHFNKLLDWIKNRNANKKPNK